MSCTIFMRHRWPCHFQINAKAHQICTAHLIRELNYMNELYKNECLWTIAFKALLQEVILIKKNNHCRLLLP